MTQIDVRVVHGNITDRHQNEEHRIVDSDWYCSFMASAQCSPDLHLRLSLAALYELEDEAVNPEV